jgi:hypothetical protein
LSALGSSPEGFRPEPQLKRQSGGINEDWARRYSDLGLGTRFDLVQAPIEVAGQA